MLRSRGMGQRGAKNLLVAERVSQSPLAASQQVVRRVFRRERARWFGKRIGFVHGGPDRPLQQPYPCRYNLSTQQDSHLTRTLPAMRVVLCYPLERRHYEQIVAACPPGTEVIDASQERIAAELLA